MRYYEIDLNGSGLINENSKIILMTSYEDRHCPPRKKRSVDIEIGKSVGCFMALVIGVTFFVLSYL